MTTQVVEFVEPKTQKKSNNVANHLEPWLQLEGKVVFVTGASAGLGREFCLDLARSGCRVVAAARRADRLKSLCDEINTMTNSNSHVVRAVAIELDVTADGTTIEASVKKAWDAFGHIDALINNAGVRGTFFLHYVTLLGLFEKKCHRVNVCSFKSSVFWRIRHECNNILVRSNVCSSYKMYVFLVSKNTRFDRSKDSDTISKTKTF